MKINRIAVLSLAEDRKDFANTIASIYGLEIRNYISGRDPGVYVNTEYHVNFFSNIAGTGSYIQPSDYDIYYIIYPGSPSKPVFDLRSHPLLATMFAEWAAREVSICAAPNKIIITYDDETRQQELKWVPSSR